MSDYYPNNRYRVEVNNKELDGFEEASVILEDPIRRKMRNGRIEKHNNTSGTLKLTIAKLSSLTAELFDNNVYLKSIKIIEEDTNRVQICMKDLMPDNSPIRRNSNITFTFIFLNSN